MLDCSGRVREITGRALTIRDLLLIGTALSCSLTNPARAEKVVFNGSGDFSATRTDTLSDTAQVVDARTTTGNLLLSFSNLQAASVTNGSALYANVSVAGAIGVTTGTVNVTGTNQTNGIFLQGTNGNITLVAGTTTANTNNADRAINVTTPMGNITITSTQADGALRGISTSDGTGNALPSGITTINSGTATANGTGQVNAIVAQGRTVNVTSGTASNTNTAGNQGAAIFVQAGDGGASIKSTTVNVVGLNQSGIQVGMSGNGAVSIDSGTVNATQSATGILVNAVGQSGVTTVKSGAINLGANSLGIDIEAGTGASIVDSGTISSSGGFSTGILVNVGSGGATIKSDNVNLTGAGTTGITVASNAGPAGAVTINSNKINVVGNSAIAYAISGGEGGGAVAVNSSAITGSAFGGGAISVNNNAGINITSGSIAQSSAASSNINSLNGAGITAIAFGTQATTINSGSIVFTGTGNTLGITAQAVGGGALNINSGTVSVIGNGGYGLLGYSTSGALNVVSTGAITTAGTTRAAGGSTAISNQRYADGIDAVSTTGAISVTNSGTISTLGAGARGIVAEAGKAIVTFLANDPTLNSTAAINVNNSGTVTTSGLNATAISVRGDNNSVTIVSNKVSAAKAHAILATSNGSVSVVATDTTSGGGSGITAFSNGGSASVSSGTVTTSANTTVAINVAGGADKDVSITSGAVTTAGTMNGYALRTYAIGLGNSTVDSGTISTAGNYSTGIDAQTYAGSSTIKSGTIITKGDGATAITSSTDSGAISINSGTISTAGQYAYGISTTSGSSPNTKGGAIVIKSDSLTTSGLGSTGINASSVSGAVSIASNSLSATGQGTTGINAAADTIAITSGSLTASGTGISAFGRDITILAGTTNSTGGTAIVAQGGKVNVTSANAKAVANGSSAVAAYGDSGIALNISSASSAGSTTGSGTSLRRADAVYANAAAGAVVATIGTAAATGVGADAVHIEANGAGGAATVNITGSVTSAQGYGLFIDPPGAVSVNVAAGATVSGSGAGISLLGGSNSVVNAGTISSSNGPALLASGLTTLDNAGVINAGPGGVAVQLGATSDSVTLRTGSSVTGTIAGGGGTDSATLAGTSAAKTSAQTLASFTGFDSLNVASGYWTVGAGSSTFNKVTIVQGASFEVANASAGLGLSVPSIVDNGTLVVRSTSAGVGSTLGATTISGSGGVLLTGSGTVTLDGTNAITTTGGITVDAGTTAVLTGTQGGPVTTNAGGVFQIGNGGTNGSFTGSLADNGTLIVNRSDDYTFSGAITGAGSIVKQGGGKLTFGTGYAFTGTTTLSGGSIKLAGPVSASTEIALEGAGVLDLSGNKQTVAELAGSSTQASINIAGGALTVSQSTNTVFAGSLTGDGSFTKSGSGSLSITGTSTYTGPTTVDGGRLAVNGSIVSNVTVNPGATLGGTGTIGGATIASGGTYAPGNSIGTQTVNGNVAFAVGSTYAVEANADGRSDRIVVTGGAALSGGTVQVLAESGTFNKLTSYNIITAGSVTGKFANVTSNMAFLSPILDYTATQVNLTLARNDLAFGAIAVGANQSAVANAIASRTLGDAVYNAVLVQSVAGGQAAFDALSGELYASLPTALVDESRRVRESVADRAGMGGDGVGIWATGLRSLAQSDARAGVARTNADRWGVVSGIDFGKDGWRLGGAAGYVNGNVDLGARSSHADVRSKLLGAYAGWRGGPLAIKGGATYAWHDIDSRRTVATTGLAGAERAEFKGHSSQAFADIAYNVVDGPLTLAPFAGYAHVRSHTDRAVEGGTAAALTVAAQTRDVDFVSLGVRLGGEAPISTTAIFFPRLSVAYQYVGGDRGGVTSSTFGGSGAAFGVTGAQLGKNALDIDGGFEIGFGKTRLGAGAFASTGNGWSDRGAKVSLTVGF